MRETSGRNAPLVANLTVFAKEHAYDLRWVEMDVSSQESVEDAIKKILAENDRLDVVIHNAGHMVFGRAEAFTPEHLAELYDINVLSTQRVNGSRRSHRARRGSPIRQAPVPSSHRSR